ncbi:MAG: 50S ribosomal protein L10 [Bacteroidetes bacterium]|nr:50S ribosomal protein L10 [Rhodothermia bacterium]MCS7155484.1 50S ribosomal protein L10 [Bacteroidota bacterium]MCX7907423.1 50S ribosomal protein L10 [Bacteroidota bacterium]MDW8138417.1 50S ribosomal protein L10 [Bacteroidota bacterium]MDW8284646.1 50S ribosomal protein L10 [Bacteroidota bacterium]
MNRAEKTQLIEQLVEKAQQAQGIYVVDFSNMTVLEEWELRRAFRKANVEYRVVKNTLLRIALERVGGHAGLLAYLNGQTAVAFGYADPIAPARLIKEYAQQNPKLRLKAASLGGEVFDGAQLEQLAAMKSRQELIGDLVGLLLAPIQNVLGALTAPGAQLVGALRTLSEREAA